MPNLKPTNGGVPATQAAEFFGGLSQTFQPVASGMGQDFLNFSGKSGRYIFNDADPEGREALINVPGMKHGYRCWVDKQPQDELVPVSVPKPPRPDPIRDADGDLQEFKDAYQIEGQFADGANEEFVFTVNSIGGCSAIEQIVNACKVQFASGSTFLYPVVLLESAPMNDQYGNYKPVFKVVNWMDDQGEYETAGVKSDPDPEPKREPRSKRKPRSRQ